MDNGFKCPVFGCNKRITGMTGLQELDKLRAHMLKKHNVRWNLEEAANGRHASETGAVSG